MPQTTCAIAFMLSVLLVCYPAFALEPGDTVEILIPSDSNQPDAPSNLQDKIIFIGGPLTTVDITGCGAGIRPVQNVVIVDPAGGRSGRITGVIVTSESEPVQPGTKITSITAIGACSITSASSTIAYIRYQGTVE